MGNEARNRQKAKELGAPDAAELIATVPSLARLLSKEQVAQIQKVLDAAVLNPKYEQAYRQAMRASVISRAGGLVLRDRVKERKARRILENKIPVSKYDGYIRVDYKKMLTPDALAPRTNNPDEIDYLMKVRQVLDSKGVWLWLNQPWATQGRDTRVWRFWFTLGYEGDIIETDDAFINRDELLGTTMLGAGYYRAVLTGPVQTKIERALARLDAQYRNGFSLHAELKHNRRTAAPGVAKVADWLGGAELPDISIWERPHKLRMTAAQACTAGDVIKAQVYLVAAAHAIEHNAELLADYTRQTISGGEKAVKILEVAKTAGEVAEVGLVVTGVGWAGIKVVRAVGSRAITQEVRYEVAGRIASAYAKKNGISEAELLMVRYVPQPKATVLGGVKGGHSAGFGGGFHRW